MSYNLLQTLDRFFGDSGFPEWQNFTSPFSGELVGSDIVPSRAPAPRVKDNENKVMVTVALPGFDKSDLHIDFRENNLSIKGSKVVERKKNVDYHVSERRSVEFNRSIYIPYGVDTKEIEANLSNGVLEIVLPKADKHIAQKIEIGQ